ncbi:hypothetical protein Bpfe_011149 [Biomphalaria pfeifferi]|uniref:Uncharacterized protein n=1 Tax=Biomphalaria pfeifferi TaxID=112525 RepID=A0AAD8BRI9_BIOPF|nr:hypothetical protein Bpfe_011149 [Biomphalaria pfeifferi]
MPEDLTEPGDLTVPEDFTVPGDLTVPEDFTVPGDFTVPEDLSGPGDLIVPEDLPQRYQFDIDKQFSYSTLHPTDTKTSQQVTGMKFSVMK